MDLMEAFDVALEIIRRKYALLGFFLKWQSIRVGHTSHLKFSIGKFSQ